MHLRGAFGGVFNLVPHHLDILIEQHGFKSTDFESFNRVNDTENNKAGI
jgi:hypothetical protein